MRQCHRVILTILAILASGPLATNARADWITFRPDPFGNPGQTFLINGFDPSAGSALVIGAIPVAPGGQDVRVVFQSQLTNVIPNASLPGLGTTYQILTLANFMENIQPVGADVVSIGPPSVAGPPNVFEMRYHNLAVPIDELTGAGYNTPGDPVILSGRVIDITGVAVLIQNGMQNLNQSGVGPPDPANTLTIDGSQQLLVAVDFFNPLFFPNPDQVLLELSISTQSTAPFDTVTPNNGVFWTGDVRNIGMVNGQDGPDILLQSDPNIGLRVVNNVIPEPATATLVLLGLGALCGRRLLRSTRRKA